MNMQLSMQARHGGNLQNPQQIPPLFIETVKIMKREENHQDLVIDKLKVMCSKAILMANESTPMDYLPLHPPYVERIKTFHREAMVFD